MAELLGDAVENTEDLVAGLSGAEGEDIGLCRIEGVLRWMRIERESIAIVVVRIGRIIDNNIGHERTHRQNAILDGKCNFHQIFSHIFQQHTSTPN